MTSKNLKISILSYFFIAFVLDGLQRLSGLFVVELLKSMSVTRRNAAVPFIFSWAVANIMSSFSDILVQDKNSEYVIFFGTLLSATGAALCILAANITTLIVFWGLLFGCGYGLASPHLSRRLNSVNSNKFSFILQLSPSLSVSTMPFVLHIFISHYGLQGSCLIFSGIILNYLPLAVAAAYNIEINIPSIKWRVRKKSSQYSVSKQEGSNAVVSIESFINSLEPDLILKINQNDKYQCDEKKDKFEVSTQESFSIGRKRSETKGNDLQGLEIDRLFSRTKTHCQMFSETKYHKNGRNFLEGNFSNTKEIDDQVEHGIFKTRSTLNCDIPQNIKILEKNILNTEPKKDLIFKNGILRKISECEIKEFVNENDELEKDYFNNRTENGSDSAHTCAVLLENTITPILHENKGNSSFQNDVRQENENLIKSELKNNLTSASQKFGSVKSLEKETLQISSEFLENKPIFNIPLDIKVHVEEYTFTTEEEDWVENFNSEHTKARKNSCRRHSNSVLPIVTENIQSGNQRFSKKFLTCSDQQKFKLSNIYAISENPEFNDKISEGKKEEDTRKGYKKEDANNIIKLNIMRFFKILDEITSPVCLCIVFIAVIFEMNLVTLLTMFADFGNDVDGSCSDFKWILVAFGAGGFVGKLCCSKISKKIPEKSHAVGVILFLLTGLSTAGILYSSNLNWLAGFYCILGALEGGITYAIPKFILEYTYRNIQSTLSSVKSFFSGAAVICIPYAIGLFRDELGDYEFLLQILSCSSVVCALLTYLLPYLKAVSDKQITTSFRGRVEMA